jgi:hypothetical protein
MPNRFAFAILATALSLSPVTAQIRGAGSGTTGFGISAGPAGTGTAGTAGFPGHAMVGGAARFRLHQGNSSARSAVLLPYPYFYSDTDAGYESREVSQPQVVVISPAPAAPPPPPAPRESLLIEWQGDHFVRSKMSANAAAGGQIAPDYSEKSALPLPAAGRSVPARRGAVEPPPQLPPAVLVFHDGRREEVSEYTIMSGAIYAKADYWTTGSWTRNIQIADLDVPATLKLNQERGLKFVLPSSPNEIVTRP